jgi:hypothetical protein
MAAGHKLALLPVTREMARRYAYREPLKGKLMTDFTDWFQNNWIDLARLLVQCAILAVVVRFGRKLLATLRASQEQVGALLKLSVSDAVGERTVAAPEPARQFEPPLPAAPDPEPEPEPVFAGASSRTSYATERDQSLGGRVIGSQIPPYSPPAFSAPSSQTASPSLTPWVSAPATEPERMSTPSLSIPPRPSVSTWLQAPMRSSGVSPWRKVVRWLQAPAGH